MTDRVHYAEYQGDGIHIDNYPWCGQANAHRTTNRYAVTCKRCLKLLETGAPSRGHERESAQP